MSTITSIPDFVPRKPQSGMLYDPNDFRNRVYEIESQIVTLTTAVNLLLKDLATANEQLASLLKNAKVKAKGD